LQSEESFRELLGRVRQTTLAAYEHQDLPFERLVEEMATERDLGRSPLFQVSLVMQNAPAELVEVPGIQVQRFEAGDSRPKLDLELVFTTDQEEGLIGSITYAADLFDRITIERFAGHLCRALKSIVANIDQRIYDIDLLSSDERSALLVEPKRTELPR